MAAALLTGVSRDLQRMADAVQGGPTDKSTPDRSAASPREHGTNAGYIARFS